MKKACTHTEEFYEKMENFVIYTEKMKTLKNITKGHKQRFINMVIEFLKLKEKTPEIQKWINYIILYHQKEINKYKKYADEPVLKKLEQLFFEFFTNNNNNKNNLNESVTTDISTNKTKENSSSNKTMTYSGNKNGKNKMIEIKTCSLSNKDNKDNINLLKEKNQYHSNEIGQEKKEENLQINKFDDNLNKSKLTNNGCDEDKLRKKISKFIKKMNSFNSIKDFIMNSIDKENKNNKVFCEIYQLTINSLAQEPEETKQKLLILVCLIFPFISNKQKLQLLPIEQQFDEKLINSLKVSKLLNKSKNNNFSEYLLQSILNKEANNELIYKMFNKNLFISNEGELFELYQLYLISKIFNFTCIKESLYKISFKIKFILNNYKDLYAHKIGSTFEYIFKTLWRIKNFYTIIYQNKFIDDENEEINYFNIYFDEKINSCGLIQKNKNISLDIDILFADEENKIYDELTQKLNRFYKINNNINLISGYSKELKNYEFPFNIIELINLKNELIVNNFQKYKLNLINIEKIIYTIGYKSLFPYSNGSVIIPNYSINPCLKNAFESLNILLHKKLNHYNFKLYPYGSVTEFLSDKESDIDLYLDISEIENNETKIHFLYLLFYIIKNFDKKASLTISTRVCVITFEFKFVSFDISVVGFCPYLHSTLIREYSLIDPRFPLLAIALKHIIKVLKINNITDDKTHAFLNSFSWVLLLIAFLQDVIKPPVLPKILKNSEILRKETFFGNNKMEKEDDDEKSNEKSNENKYEKYSKNKNFESFINNLEMDNIEIPKNLGDIYLRIKNYKTQISKKNTMSCSELLLKFLEFVVFYFKYDTLFINNSFVYEGFQNMENINDEMNYENSAFVNYFNNKYIKKNKGEKTKDGYFLIRDPFDSRYNPGQTLKASSIKKFFSRLKMAYYHLVKYGHLNLLKKQVEYEENTNKNNN